MRTLIEEAETRLAGLRAWLLIASQAGHLDIDSESPARLIGALESKAIDAGSTDIAEIAHDLASQFDIPLSGRGTAAQSDIRRLLDAVVRAEARIASIRFETEDTPIDVATFVERSFDFLQLDPEVEKRSAKDNFEIDSEMLEIFLTEAEELVANIDDNLSRLRDDPANSNALWEIRRSTHTFKGAAGIVGLRKPSELAHRIEDLIDRFADDRVESKDRITQLLSNAIQCLQALTNGENSGGLVERIERLYADFDELLAAGAKREEHRLTEEGTAAAHPPQTPRVPVSPALPGRQIVRISQNRLDDLFRIVCDLVVSRTIFEQRLSDFGLQIDELNDRTRRLQVSPTDGRSSDAIGQMLSMNGSLYNVRDSLAMLFEHQRQLVEQIHRKLVGIRMVEFGSIAGRLQRTVRNTCTEENKLAEMSIENEKLEIDTQIVDHLIEPLMHLLKNAVVHGIETPDIRRLLGKPEIGQIRLRAVHDETHIVFTVSDDGSGIGRAALKEKAIIAGHVTREDADELSESQLLDLVFLTGVTPAEKLTMNAGRGVGMNIVRESIESRQGTITVGSTPQSGTTFTIKMPLPMTVSKVLIVTAAGQRYAIPMRLIRNVAERSSVLLQETNNERSVNFGNEEYPLIGLDKLLHDPAAKQHTINPLILFIGSENFRVGLAVESVLWTDEILFKPLGKINGNTALLGEGILADNSIVPLPDLEHLVRNYAPQPAEHSVAPVERPDNMVMIIDDSPSVRYLVSKLVEGLGCIVETANDGKDALTKMGLTKQKPALIISDIEMPRMDGLGFLAIVKNDPTL